ncbi:MAG: hypothetical protein Q7R80_00495 [bacterium]|nr:hypothetical protein [bacterium]
MPVPDKTVVGPPPGPWPHISAPTLLEFHEGVRRAVEDLARQSDRLNRVAGRLGGRMLAEPARVRDETGSTGWVRASRAQVVRNVAGRLHRSLRDIVAEAFVGAWVHVVRQAIVEEAGPHTTLGLALLPTRELDARLIRMLHRAGYRTSRWIDVLEYALADLLQPNDVRTLLVGLSRELRRAIAATPDGAYVASAMTMPTILAITRDPSESGYYRAAITGPALSRG